MEIKVRIQACSHRSQVNSKDNHVNIGEDYTGVIIIIRVRRRNAKYTSKVPGTANSHCICLRSVKYLGFDKYAAWMVSK